MYFIFSKLGISKCIIVLIIESKGGCNELLINNLLLSKLINKKLKDVWIKIK